MNNHYTTALLALEAEVQPSLSLEMKSIREEKRRKIKSIRADIKQWSEKEKLRNRIINNFYSRL